jgi:ATP-binding cassette subfamily F protein uup
MNRVCTHILAFQDDGTLFFQPGDYNYYLEKRNEMLAAAAASAGDKKESRAVSRPVEAEAPKKNKVKLTWKEQRELEGIGDAISAAEAEVARLEECFADPQFHVKYAQQTKELTAQLDAARQKVEELYVRWDELEAKNSAQE